MPSREMSSTSASPPKMSACSLILVFLLCFRKRKRTTPSSDDSDSNPPHPFSYALLRRATSSFSTLLGHGGFGPVFSGSLPPAGKPVAVKVMDSASLQGEREFHNELFFASRLRSPLLVPAIGFSSDPKRRRFLLVYDLMHNGNLHDALLRHKSPQLTLWTVRFSILLDIARAILYLHSCDPPVIHGDIKPSNILLDRSFSAKIADFGLARLKSASQFESHNNRKEDLESDGGSLAEETESVNAGFEEQSFEGEREKGIVGAGGVNKGGRVKDYVMDWIGKEVSEERPTGEWVPAAASTSATGTGDKNNKSSDKKKKLEWWESMDEEKGAAGVLKKENRRPAREWWKEEYSQELAKKKKKKKERKSDDDWWERDDHDAALYGDGKRGNKNRSRKGRGSGNVDSWFSGELRRARWNSYDSGSGEIPKSGGISSTPSMRGTVFYVAPEYGYSGDASEKCDVYSFGVLLLVIVSGRRPLQVTESPMSEFKRANLVSWARHCARHGNGKLLELVDQSIQSLDREQALLCINVALLCLLKSPARRPSMKEVVGMLSGELEPPQSLLEYSQSHFPFKSRKEAR